MSSDLSVPRVGAAAASVDAARTHVTTSAGTTAAASKGDGAGSPVPPAGKSLPNPTLRLDPGLAIVVIEFRDDTGAVRSTIPTEQQLDAYRAWERGHTGESPRSGTAAAADGSPKAAATGAAGPRPSPAPGSALPGSGRHESGGHDSNVHSSGTHGSGPHGHVPHAAAVKASPTGSA